MALIDLDELVLKCRTENSKLYIEEAISCYKARAYRSAIVATWIAVCFDLLDKIRELELSGDKEAAIQLGNYEKIRKNEDLSAALKFEKTLLDLAKDKFEFLSNIEYIDLKRLQEDRNRCAHPSLTIDDNTYMPSGELARSHIYSAVVHLLQHAPAQGKVALEKIIKDLESDYFPTMLPKIVDRFKHGPIKRARSSLIRNLLTILIKRSISNEKYTLRSKFWDAINAIHQIHPEQVEKVLKEQLSPTMRNILDDDLIQITQFLGHVQLAQNLIENDVRDRLIQYTTRLPTGSMMYLDRIIEIPFLKKPMITRINRAEFDELAANLHWLFPTPTEVYDRIIAIYLQSKDFAEANLRGKFVAEIVKELSEKNVKDILIKGSENSQVARSNQVDLLLRRLKDAAIIPEAEFDALMADADFDTL